MGRRNKVCNSSGTKVDTGKRRLERWMKEEAISAKSSYSSNTYLLA